MNTFTDLGTGWVHLECGALHRFGFGCGGSDGMGRMFGRSFPVPSKAPHSSALHI